MRETCLRLHFRQIAELGFRNVPDSWHPLLLRLLPTTPCNAFQPNTRTSHIFIDSEEERDMKGNKLAFTEHFLCVWLLYLALSLSHWLLKETLKGQCHFPQFTNEETDTEKFKVTTLKERQLWLQSPCLPTIQIWFLKNVREKCGVSAIKFKN